MNVLVFLIPIALLLGIVGLVAFLFTVRARQYDDPEGNARRILNDQWDDAPKP
ncbi:MULTISPECIES: cbb3-type cytochrome oxidase assembly protein CcoS [unclassified Marinovum]